MSKTREGLYIESKVEWNEENIKEAEKEGGFKILEYEATTGDNEGSFYYNALVEWN